MPAIGDDEFEVEFRIEIHSTCADEEISRLASQRTLERFRFVEDFDLSCLTTSSIDN